MKEIRVETDPVVSIVMGRNGHYRIKAVTICPFAVKKVAFIEGTGRSGKSIHGGFMLPTSTLNELARRLAIEHPAVKRLVKAAMLHAAKTHYGQCRTHSKKKGKCNCPVGELGEAINNLYKSKRGKKQ